MFTLTSAFGQVEKDIASTIKKVTVFTQGAQIEREAGIVLQQGPMVLKLTGLSPYIKKESIRIDGDDSFTILSVQHQNDYINELGKSLETEALKVRIEEIQYLIEDDETRIKIIKEKIDFLNVNKVITGKEQAVNPENFKSLNSIYGSNIETLHLDVLKKQRQVNDYKRELNKINNQFIALNSKADLPSGTIILSIDSKQTKASKLKFNYLVNNASWYPSYDIRFSGVNKPLTVNYKANVNQNTGIDWKDISLVLSTAQTDVSAQIPNLSPFYLQFYYPQVSRTFKKQSQEFGLFDIEGTSEVQSDIRIRGIASIDGKNEPLYIVDGIAQSDISSLTPGEIENIEVLKDASATSVYGSRAANGVVLVTTRQSKDKSSIPLTITSKMETSNEYLVDAAQTILSTNKTTSINYREMNLDTNFEYQAVPKLSAHVFLIAKIPDWYKAELIDGEVNLYLENSFVGKSFINTQQFSDTLELSFGIDNNISVKREKLSEYSESQFIGSNRKESVAYKITIRNNKTYAVTTKITDQIPVSTIKGIQVESVDVSGGKIDAVRGKVEWEIALKPNESKELIIRYSVRYPKDKRVMVE